MPQKRSKSKNAALHGWTPKQLQQLKYHYPIIRNLDDLCKKISKSKNQIVYRASVLGLHRSHMQGCKILMPKDVNWVVKNFNKFTNDQFAKMFNCDISVIRRIFHERNMFRIILEYWTDEQITFLKNHFKTIGDKELSYIFNIKFPKLKQWTMKHIEKKRKYLNLKRTKSQIDAIRQRNKKRGAWLGTTTWETRGVAPDGEIRLWKASYNKKNGDSTFYKVVKIDGKFHHYAHYLWSQVYGKMKPGHVVGFKDRDNLNCTIENLECITRAEHARRNRISMYYPEDLQRLIALNTSLQKQILKLKL